MRERPCFVALLLAGRRRGEAEGRQKRFVLNLMEVAFWSSGFPGAEEEVSAVFECSLSGKQGRLDFFTKGS